MSSILVVEPSKTRSKLQPKQGAPFGFQAPLAFVFTSREPFDGYAEAQGPQLLGWLRKVDKKNDSKLKRELGTKRKNPCL